MIASLRSAHITVGLCKYYVAHLRTIQQVECDEETFVLNSFEITTYLVDGVDRIATKLPPVLFVRL